MKNLLKVLTKEVGTEVLEMGHETFSMLLCASVSLFLSILFMFIFSLLTNNPPAKAIIECVALLIVILYFTVRIAMYED